MPRLRFLQAFHVLVKSGTLVEDAQQHAVHCRVCSQIFRRGPEGGVAANNSMRRAAAAHVLHNHRRVYDSAIAVTAAAVNLKAEAAGGAR